jgi:hypothetical protein
MNLNEYADFDGLGLAELVKKREISPAELARRLRRRRFDWWRCPRQYPPGWRHSRMDRILADPSAFPLPGAVAWD